MSLLSPTWRGAAFFWIVVRVSGERGVRDGYDHLVVLGEGSQSGVVLMPKGGGIDGWRWEFIGDLERLEVDGRGR